MTVKPRVTPKKQVYEGYAGRKWTAAEGRIVHEDRKFAVEAENWTEAATLMLGEFMKSYITAPSRRFEDTFYVRDIRTAEDIARQRGVSLDRLAIRNGTVVVEPES